MESMVYVKVQRGNAQSSRARKLLTSESKEGGVVTEAELLPGSLHLGLPPPTLVSTLGSHPAQLAPAGTHNLPL